MLRRFVVISALLLLVLSGCRRQPLTSDDSAATVRVVASFYPLAYFAQRVGGDLVEVANTTPAGVEPHDFEATPQQLVRVYQSQLFLANGNGVDAWAEGIRSDLEQRGVRVVVMSEHLSSLPASAGAEEGEVVDPHYWLDPVNAMVEVDAITDALIAIDGSHQEQYEQQRDAFKQQLHALDQEYQLSLADCATRTFITSHAAFGYLAQRYQLDQHFLAGLSPDEEPTPQAIVAAAAKAEQQGIKYIFFETLVSPKLSETVADEIGARTLVLNPIEGLTDEELAQGATYLSVMHENLANLRLALSCQ